ncbi:MAG: gliding motility-associated C-terminal domain-containing protein [Bacteroidota bacterium]
MVPPYKKYAQTSRLWQTWSLFLLLSLAGIQGYSQAIITPSEANILLCTGDDLTLSVIIPQTLNDGTGGMDFPVDSVHWELELSGGSYTVIDTTGSPTFSISSTDSSLQITNAPDSLNNSRIKIVVFANAMALNAESQPKRLFVRPSPSPFSSITKSFRDEICGNQPVRLTLNGGSFVMDDIVQWFRNDNLLSNISQQQQTQTDVRQPGVYSAWVVGCDTTSRVEITITEADTATDINQIQTLSGLTSFCPGSTVALFPGNTGDGTITWYSDQGNTEISTNDTLTFLLDQDTTIYARRIACDQSPLVSISLAFTPLPLAPERIEGPSETLCAGATVTLTVIDDGATATDTFQWLTTPTGPVIATGTSFTIDAVAAGSTTYFVRKKDVCDNLSPTINYEVEALAIPSVGALQIPDGLCLDLAGDFSVSQPSPTASYTWDFGENASVSSGSGPGPIAISFDQSGLQAITVDINVGGCTSRSVDTIVVVDPPTVTVNGRTDLSTPFEIVSGEEFAVSFEVVSTETVTVDWEWMGNSADLGDDFMNSGTSENFTEVFNLEENTEETTVVFTATINTPLCSENVTFSVLVLNELPLIPNILTPNDDGFNDTWEIIYNPPANQVVSDTEVKIYNRQGVCVCGCTETFTLADAVNWDGANLPSGPYWYVITRPERAPKTGSLTILR